MNKNKSYHIYERLAILVIVTCWGIITFTQETAYPEQFMALQEAQMAGLKRNKAKNIEGLKTIIKDVRRFGNSREGLERIKRAQFLKHKTGTLIDYIAHIKQSLTSQTIRQMRALMLDQGQGMDLKHRLDKHVDWLSLEFKDFEIPQFEKIAKGNAANPLFEKYSMAKNKNFVEANFTHTPVAASLAVLTQKQLILQRYEAAILKKLGSNGEFGSTCCLCNSWYVTAYQTSKLVQVGDELSADLLINRNASQANPRFAIGNIPLPVMDGQSKISFQTQAQGKQYWEAKFVYRIREKDTTIIHQIPFLVLPKK